jgi:hypothetical protein
MSTFSILCTDVLLNSHQWQLFDFNNIPSFSYARGMPEITLLQYQQVI